MGGKGRLAPSPPGILANDASSSSWMPPALITPGATGVTVEHLLGMECLEQRWCRAQMGGRLKTGSAWLGLAWLGLSGGGGLGGRGRDMVQSANGGSLKNGLAWLKPGSQFSSRLALVASPLASDSKTQRPSVPGIKCLGRAQMGAVLKAAWLGLAWGSAWRGLTGGWGLGWRGRFAPGTRAKCSCSHHRCHGCSLAVLITPGGTGITVGLR